MKINEKIRTLREINNLTQENMAEKLQMSVNGYANLERGESKIYTGKLEQIAHVFGMELSELISFGEKSTVFCMVGEGNINHGLNFIGRVDDHELLHAVDKLQSELNHKEEIISLQNKEIQSLKETIEFLKSQIAN